MKKILLLISSLFLITNLAYAKKQKIVYKYKKYEKFDMAVIDVSSGSGAPGDISISPQYKKKYRNKLPYKRNMNREIIRSVNRIR